MATRTIANGGGNFSAAGTWVEGVAPIAGDACVATATSGQLTIDVASACTSIDFTNYVNTLTWNADLTTAGTTKFVAGMTMSGTVGTLVLSATCTLTSGGKTLPNYKISGSITVTYADAARVSGTTTLGANANNTIVMTAQSLRCDGNLTEQHGTGTVTGTCNVTLGGTGTWSTNNTTGSLRTNLTINTAGTVTVSGTVNYSTGTLTYTAGTVVVTGSTLFFGTTVTLNTSGMNWEAISHSSSGATFTLNSDLNFTGTFTIGGGSTYAGTGEIKGNVTISAASTHTLNNGTNGINTTGTLTLPNAATTFAGSKGFSVGTMTTTDLTASRIHTLTFGNTYTVNTLLKNGSVSNSIRQAIKSSSAGSKVVLTVVAGPADLVYCDPTDIDSSGGVQVFTHRGTVATSTNWTATIPTGSAGAIKFAGDGGGFVG